METYDQYSEKLIRDSRVIVGYGAELLDEDDNVIEDLSPFLKDGGEVQYKGDTDIQRTCTISLTKELAWKEARVQLWQTLKNGTREVTVHVVDRPAGSVSRTDNSDASWSEGTLTDTVAVSDALSLDVVEPEPPEDFAFGPSVATAGTADITTGYFAVQTNVTAPTTGTITTINYYSTVAATLWIYTGTYVGSTFTIRARASIATGTTGKQSATVNLPVQAGDCLGVWASATMPDSAISGGAIRYVAAGSAPTSGDQVTTAALSQTVLVNAAGVGPENNASYQTSGTRVAPPLSLAGITQVDSSLVSWAATVPSGTALAVETSVDAGATWQAATNGGAVPGAAAGGTVLSRLTLTGDGTATPTVSSLSVTVSQAGISHETTETVPNVERFDQGVFLLKMPTNEIGETPAAFDVTGFDKLQLMQHSVGDSYVAYDGVSYLNAARQVIIDSGYTGKAPYFAGDAETKVLDEPMVWLSPTKYSWLDIVNQLLKAIGYRKLWVDKSGRYRSEPEQTPQFRPPEWVFNTALQRVSIVGEKRTFIRDVFDEINWWRFVQKAYHRAPSEGNGYYTVDRTNDDVRHPKITELSAADQDSLVAQGNALIADEVKTVDVWNIEAAVMPILGNQDVVQYTDVGFGSMKALITEYKIPLDGKTNVPMRLEVISNG